MRQDNGTEISRLLAPDQEVDAPERAQLQLRAERDRLAAELAKVQASMAQELADWDRMHEMSNQLVRARSLRDQFALVLDTVIHFSGATKGVISLYDPQRKGLVAQATRGLSEIALDTVQCVPIGQAACGLAFSEERRVIVEDAHTDPCLQNYRDYARREGMRAVCSTPFYSSTGDALGVLSVYFPAPHRPAERELRLTDICAGQLALFVERHQADQQRHREQSRSHQILNSMKDGFVLLDRDYTVLQINAAGLAIERRPASEIVGKSHWEVWPGTWDMQHGQIYRQVMQDRQARSFETKFEHGTPTWFDVLVYPEGDGIAILYRDITEKKIQEERLASVIANSERKRRLYETVLDNSPDLAYVFDLNRRFIYANEGLLRMWGKTWDEAIGKNCLEIGYEPWQAAMHEREIDRVIATKQAIRAEVPFDGSFGRRIYEYIMVPVIGPDGEVEAVAGTTRDMTERKQTEESLRDTNRRKDEFLAMLAHELRNPLAPISAAAELLKLAGNDRAKVEMAGQIISRQVTHMTSLVSDLLDVSRVTRGLVELEKQAVDIEQVVNAAVEQARPLIEARSHTLSTQIFASHAMVCADKVRLVQVLSNLLNNAAKYTPQGGKIELDVQADADTVAICIADNGIGIEPSLLPHVFDLFTQAERSSDRSQGGLGLGLALVMSIVDLHGGRVEAKSQGMGQGSRFQVSLPRLVDGQSECKSAPPCAQHDAGQRPLRLMLVDDNVDAAETLAALLQAEGHEVSVAVHPRDAMQIARAHAPEVCILDIGLPGMNGYELARSLRDLPATRDSVLIALTGYGQPHDKVLAQSAGFTHYFVKPVDLAALIQVLQVT